MTEEKLKQIENYDLETAMKRLEELAGKMSGEGLKLEESLALYEEGVALVRICTEKLDASERRINMLKVNADGEIYERPFDTLET